MQKLTWAECVAGDLLYRHALAESPAVERRRVSTGSRSLLDTPPTRHIAGRPLRPQGPAAVHWREFNKVREYKKRCSEGTTAHFYFFQNSGIVKYSNEPGLMIMQSARHWKATMHNG